MNLVRNCSHYSKIHTYVDDGIYSAKTVRKVSFFSEGARDLARELEGLTWYAKIKGLAPDDIIMSHLLQKKYSALVLKFWEGKIFSPYSPPETSVTIFDAILENYCEVFGACDFKFSHGDFSLGNHVFRGGKVCWLIDWEHFNNQLPPGYDLVYAILESFLFHFMARKSLTKSVVGAGKKILLEAQQKVPFDREIVDRPASWLRETAFKHKDVWGKQYYKLPFAVISSQRIAEFDELFRRAL